MEKNKKALDIIGSTEYVDVAGVCGVPAKIDTGADSSSIWASHINVTKDGVLHFRLFDEESPFYTGEELQSTNFKAAVIRSSSGHEQIRYRAHLKTTINGRNIKILYSLSDRSANVFPILIGRRSILGKYLVDVSKNNAPIPTEKSKTMLVQRSLQKDPYEFHRKFIRELGGDINRIKKKGL